MTVLEERHDFEYIWIQWAGFSASKKTQKYIVQSKRGDLLGWIKWSGRWRQYVFHPEPGTLYSAGCLDDVASFLRDATSSQRRSA